MVLKYANIGPISVYLPERVETNEDLARQFPQWNMPTIESKTGIRQRHIAADGELSSDMAVQAAEQLFAEGIDRDSIDFVLLCTQTPDYPLPTTACLVQDRLGLPTRVGALDFNLGCSGFVYGVGMADGLIRSSIARRVLLITSETYSKYIHESDRSLRTIFGDGAAATLIEAGDSPSLQNFRFGTDGSGGDTLLVTEGGMRDADQAIQPRHRKRWPSALYMDGPSLLSFTIGSIPSVVEEIIAAAGWQGESVDYFLMHQATRKMLEQLRNAIGAREEQLPIELELVGNTVSSTIPILIHDLRKQGQLTVGTRNLLVGFGVGLSWGACTWEETWTGNQG